MPQNRLVWLEGEPAYAKIWLRSPGGQVRRAFSVGLHPCLGSHPCAACTARAAQGRHAGPTRVQGCQTQSWKRTRRPELLNPPCRGQAAGRALRAEEGFAPDYAAAIMAAHLDACGVATGSFKK